MILEMYLKGHYSRQNGNICFIFLYLCSFGNNASILLCTGWSSSNRLHYMPSCTQHIFWWYHNICVVYNIDVFCFSGSPFFFSYHIPIDRMLYIFALLNYTAEYILSGHLCKIQRLITHEISFVYIQPYFFRFCVYDHTRYIISYCCR